MQNCAAGYDLQDIEDVQLQRLQENRPSPGLQDAKRSLHNTSRFRQVTIKMNLEFVIKRLYVRGHEGHGLFEAGVATIPSDIEAWWRVSL